MITTLTVQRITPVAPPVEGILQLSDLTFDGYIKVPQDDPFGAKTYWSYSLGAMTHRFVNGELHLIISGVETRAGGDYNHVGCPPYEISIPPANPNYDSASRGTLIRNWGDVYQGRRLTGNHDATSTRGFWWDETLGGIYWAYGDIYNVAGYHDPSIGFSTLNSNGTSTAYGPWRTAAASQKTRGFITQYPQDFADAYMDGWKLSVGAPPTSGNASSSVGLGQFVLETFNPLTLPPSSAQASPSSPAPIAIDNIPLVDYDGFEPQPRPSDYYSCGWAIPGAHSTTVGSTPVGSTTLTLVSTTNPVVYGTIGSYAFTFGSIDYYGAFVGPDQFAPLIYYTGISGNQLIGIPASGGGSIATSIPAGTTIQLNTYDLQRGGVLAPGEANFNNNGLRMDLFSAAAYIKNDVVEGLLVAGQMGVSPSHYWYGPTNYVSGSQGICPHEHIGASAGTGPMCDTVRPIASILSREELRKSAQQEIEPYELTFSTDLVSLTTITGASQTFPNINSAAYYLGNFTYVRSINKLFIINNYLEMPYARPVILQYSVRST